MNKENLTLAKLRHAKISPQKLRLVSNQIRGLHVEEAYNILKFSNKKAATIISKVLDSAISNAEQNDSKEIDKLFVSKIFVDQGPTQKRIKTRAKGRADRILKRSSHLTIAVAEQ